MGIPRTTSVGWRTPQVVLGVTWLRGLDACDRLVIRARITVTYSPQTAEGAEMKRVAQKGPTEPRQ